MKLPLVENTKGKSMTKAEMKTKRLGNSELLTTPVGFGAWQSVVPVGSLVGASRMTKRPSRRFIARLSLLLTGSTRRPFMEWATPRK
jgi:hypothetical protein